jgi:DNA-binding LacI/PurR family transcriptional regulator
MARLTKSKAIIRFLQKEAVKSYGPEGSQGRKLKTVRQMAEKFNTTPNTVCKAVDYLARRGIIEKHQGRGMFFKKAKATKTVALVIESDSLTKDTGMYIPLLLVELERAFRKYYWSCRYFMNINTEFGIQEFDASLIYEHIDAVVFVSQWFFENKLAEVESQNIPCVGIYSNGDLRYSVSLDLFALFQTGFSEIQKLGCKTIAMICEAPHQEWNEYGKRLYDGQMKYAADHIGKDMIVQIPLSAKGAFQAMKKLWEEKRTDGILIFNEAFGQGAISAILSMGLSIPDDIVVAIELKDKAEKQFSLPVIELRVPIQDQADVIAGMISAIDTGQKIENNNVFLSPLVSNPFLNGSMQNFVEEVAGRVDSKPS